MGPIGRSRAALRSRRPRGTRRWPSWLAAGVVFALLSAPCAAAPQSLRSLDDVRDVTESFVRTVVAGRVAEAVRALGRFWSQPPGETGKRVGSAERVAAERRKRLGLAIGYERLDEERVGERLVRIRYLERLDRTAVVWSFVFYRPDEVWLLVDLSSSEELEPLFD